MKNDMLLPFNTPMIPFGPHRYIFRIEGYVLSVLLCASEYDNFDTTIIVLWELFFID